jgi:alpha-tubulin suppressor-like RCC1 family protein
VNLFARLLALLRWVLLSSLLAGTGLALATKTYSDNGDGTVTDPTTGLIWKRCSEGQTWENNTCTGTASTYTFALASALTRRVTFAGKSDWRLPNIRELLTVVNWSSVSSPAIDTAMFPNTPNSVFWSSTTTGASKYDLTYIANFGGGGVKRVVHSEYNAPVRLVRAGQSLGLLDVNRPDADYVDQGNGTVTHTPTGLTWQRCAVGQTWTGTNCSGTESNFTWNAAMDLTSSFAGKTDWRMPSIDELLSLVDFKRSGPAINTKLFPNLPLFQYLCSDTSWTVSFYNGDTSYTSYESSYLSVRFVRSEPVLVPLTITKNGTGTVSSSTQQGIDCGTACTGSYITGTTVTLSATPPENLIAWGGACSGKQTTCTVTMDAAKAVTASFSVVTTPGAPTLPTAVAGNGSITISFMAPEQSGSSAIRGYEVSCDSGATVLGTASPVTVNGLTNGTPYVCTVKAYNGSGTGAASAPINATPTGVGLARLSTNALGFDPFGVGKTTSGKSLTLTNTGTGALTIASINTTGDFAKDTYCRDTLASMASCTIVVSFTPSAAGLRTGTLSLTTSENNTPLIVNLTGTGVSTLPKLSALTLTGAHLLQTFSTEVTSYNASLSDATATVTVNAVAVDAGSTLSLLVNDKPVQGGIGSTTHPLDFGVNTLTVRVLAADGSTNTDYNIAIPRMAPTISGGHYHSVALKPDGTLWAWGGNSSGQLGDKTNVDVSVPKSIGSNFIAVAAGELHTVAIKTDGSLWTWGGNANGQLGNHSTISTNAPQQIGSDYKAVAAGRSHALAIKTDGNLWVWGSNSYGQLGAGTGVDQLVPKYMGAGFRAVAAGLDHSLALANNGDIFAWGLNEHGQLGNGGTTNSSERVLVGSGFMAISASGHHCLALKSNGDLYAWGQNTIGNGVKDNQLSPVQIGSGYSAIAAGFEHNMALKPDGSLWAWGSNSTGQLGDGSTTDSTTPKPIGSGFSAVTAGRGYTVALKNDGSVWALGSNRFGQLGDGTLAQRQAAALVVNDSVNGPLDMDPSKAKDIPADKLPPFWLQVSRSNTVSTTLTYNSEDIDQNGAVYVVAYLDPASPLLADSPALPQGKHAARMVTKGGSTLVMAVLTNIGTTLVPRFAFKQSAFGMVTESVYNGNLNSSSKTIAMFDASKFDPTKDKGIFCVGYVGKSAKGLKRSVVTGADAAGLDCPPIQIGDTTAPSVPQSIAATAAGPGQVKLTWTAANDDVGVVHYHVYRGDTKIATLDNVTSYNDTDPKASTHYSYSVMACDAANNCSGQSTPIETTTPTQPNVVLAKGWNLVGNGGNTPMNVPALFGDASKVISLWKWVKSGNAPNIISGWAFYTPLQPDGGASIAASKGYDTLSIIQSGEGFWVRANEAFSVPMTAPAWILSDVFAPGQSNALSNGWNLIATGEAKTPRAFKETVGSFKTLWAWDSGKSGWYFHSPALDDSGELAGYRDRNGYLDFGAMTFQSTTGFWVNMP